MHHALAPNLLCPLFSVCLPFSLCLSCSAAATLTVACALLFTLLHSCPVLHLFCARHAFAEHGGALLVLDRLRDRCRAYSLKSDCLGLTSHIANSSTLSSFTTQLLNSRLSNITYCIMSALLPPVVCFVLSLSSYFGSLSGNQYC